MEKKWRGARILPETSKCSDVASLLHVVGNVSGGTTAFSYDHENRLTVKRWIIALVLPPGCLSAAADQKQPTLEGQEPRPRLSQRRQEKPSCLAAVHVDFDAVGACSHLFPTGQVKDARGAA